MCKSTMVPAGLAALLGAVLASPCAAHSGLLDGHVTVGDSAGLTPPGDFTLEAWIRPTLFHFDGDQITSYQQIIYKWSGGSVQRSYLMALYQDQVEFALSHDGTYEDYAGFVGSTHLSLNQWVHVAAVYNGGTMAIFINGVQEPETGYLAGGAFQEDDPVRISGVPPSRTFHGSVDEVRISYVARYTCNFTPPAYQFWPDSDTALLMHMNEGGGTFTENLGLIGGDGTLDSSSWGEGAPIGVWQPGDLNCDGSVGFGDINPFVLALTDWSHYLAYYPNCDIWLADINGDGYVDFADINPFVALLTGH
jgi:hypothetical protein